MRRISDLKKRNAKNGKGVAKPGACWVYVLECGDGSYYTGWTNDLKKRVRAHQSGNGGKYTRSRLPVRLIKRWKAKDRREAMSKEAMFKALSRKEKHIRLGLG